MEVAFALLAGLLALSGYGSSGTTTTTSASVPAVSGSTSSTTAQSTTLKPQRNPFPDWAIVLLTLAAVGVAILLIFVFCKLCFHLRQDVDFVSYCCNPERADQCYNTK